MWRELSEVLEEVAPDEPSVPGGTAGDDVEVLELREEALIEAELGEVDREALLDAWYAERVRGPSEMRQRATQTWRHDAGRLLDPEGLAPLVAFRERARLLSVTRSAARPTGVEAITCASSLSSLLFLPYEGKETGPFDEHVFSPDTPLGTPCKVATDFGTHLVVVEGRGEAE